MLKRRILNWLLSHLFNAVTEADGLVYSDGKFYNQGIEIPPEQADKLTSEAYQIQHTTLWPLLLSSMKWAANKKMYLDSSSDSDIVAGKWMLYTIDIIEKKIINLSKIK